ncbi:hypothetical protein CDAR_479191 [Caerostris darwini]|uniref:Uncharacterized protein n=1 Tax=Caerostris darwini TaxID=1538125 RepID=A0AAV4UW56_9ARAC|nr:hypothetical protein CDAR_479191 [Caerostris darwini]
MGNFLTLIQIVSCVVIRGDGLPALKVLASMFEPRKHGFPFSLPFQIPGEKGIKSQIPIIYGLFKYKEIWDKAFALMLNIDHLLIEFVIQNCCRVHLSSQSKYFYCETFVKNIYLL